MKKNHPNQEVVVITGAASGIGRELVIKYVERGAQVVGLDLKIESLNSIQCRSFKVDVTQSQEVQKTAELISAEIGTPTIWINNAGITALGAFDDIGEPEFNRVMAVNFDGVVNGTRAALSVMKNPIRGTIVNMASVAGIVPAPYMSSYVASKHAVVGFTRAMRLELEMSHRPIQMLLVTPGFVKTQIMAPQGNYHFPNFLNFMVSDAAKTAQEIIKGIASQNPEIQPTASGKIFLNLNRIMPKYLSKSSRLLVARNVKEFLGVSPIKK